MATGGIFTHPSALLVLRGCPTAGRCQPPPAGPPLVGALRGVAGTPALPWALFDVWDITESRCFVEVCSILCVC